MIKLKALTIALAFAMSAACAARVQVTPVTPVEAPTTLTVTNELNLPINVYVRSGETEELIGQVPANSNRPLAVRFAPGLHVTLRATRADGSSSFVRNDFVLARACSWKVP